MHKMAAPNGTAPTGLEAPLSAPKYGTLIPNRIFVGGISGDTTESDLCRVFSAYGNVKSTKIIVDRAGVSKGYGFVTFETEQEAQRLQTDGECVVLRDRKLNIAPAIKKQSIVATNGAVYYATTPPAPIGNMPIDQFAAAVYPPGAAGGMPALYPPSMQYQPFYQYYSVPMNVPTIWPQNYQDRENISSHGHSRDRDNVVGSSNGFGSSSSYTPVGGFNSKFLIHKEPFNNCIWKNDIWSISKGNNESKFW